jgi:hypothetical protein
MISGTGASGSSTVPGRATKAAAAGPERGLGREDLLVVIRDADRLAEVAHDAEDA